MNKDTQLIWEAYLTKEGREDVDWSAAGKKAHQTRKYREELRKKFPNPKEQSNSFWTKVKPTGSEPIVHGAVSPPEGEISPILKPSNTQIKSPTIPTTGKVKSPIMIAAGKASWVTRAKNRVRRLESGL